MHWRWWCKQMHLYASFCIYWMHSTFMRPKSISLIGAIVMYIYKQISNEALISMHLPDTGLAFPRYELAYESIACIVHWMACAVVCNPTNNMRKRRLFSLQCASFQYVSPAHIDLDKLWSIFPIGKSIPSNLRLFDRLQHWIFSQLQFVAGFHFCNPQFRR